MKASCRPKDDLHSRCTSPKVSNKHLPLFPEHCLSPFLFLPLSLSFLFLFFFSIPPFAHRPRAVANMHVVHFRRSMSGQSLRPPTRRARVARFLSLHFAHSRVCLSFSLCLFMPLLYFIIGTSRFLSSILSFLLLRENCFNSFDDSNCSALLLFYNVKYLKNKECK